MKTRRSSLHKSNGAFRLTKQAKLFLAAGLASLLALLSQSQAATLDTWVSGTISAAAKTWSTNANWVDNSAPANTGTVSLDFSNVITTGAVVLNNNIGGLSIYQMTLAKALNTQVQYSGSSVNWVQDGGIDPQIIFNVLGSSGQNQILFPSTVAAGVTLQVTGTSTNLLNVSGVMSGAGGLHLNKPGTYVASGAHLYTGDFTLTQGDLALGLDTVGSPGSLTSGPLGRGNVIINGGILRATSLGQRTLGNSVQINGNFTAGTANNKSLTLSGDVLLTGTGVTRTITGGFSGTAAADTNSLTISGAINEAGAGNGIAFANSSATKIVLSGTNTYTGDTTVNGGQLTLSANAGLKFVIGANGVANQILGTGTVLLDGNFTFDLSGAGTGSSDSWSIVNVGTLTETFGATFGVVGFTDMGGNIWEKANGGTTYRFDESTGLLSVIPEPGAWELLAIGLTAVGLFRRRRTVR